MNILIGILGMFWLSLHMTACVLNMILMSVALGAGQAGEALWAVPAVCLALLALDWTGRVRLSGAFGKLLAAAVLPALGGLVDVLLRDWTVDPTPPVWGCTLSLLGLAGYVLLRAERREDALDQAAVLLEQGSCLTIAESFWLQLVVGVTVLLLVFGSVITLLLGALFASEHTLLDYAGVAGLLLGLLALHLVQSALFCRGARLARRADLHSRAPLVCLFIPVWNLFQAGRLEGRLRERKKYSGF